MCLTGSKRVREKRKKNLKENNGRTERNGKKKIKMSQVDMFLSQPEVDNPVPSTPRVVSTCPPRLNMWKWLILFDHDESVRCPFMICPASRFGAEIKDSWTKSVLSSPSRKKPLKLSALENKSVSLFGKIESSKQKTYN